MGNRKTKIKDEIYWRMRSKRSGQKSVLWQNETYNKLFRKMEIKIINKLINKFHISTNAICDIGCGIGIISKYLAEKFTPICLIAVDLEEMIEVAQKKSYAKNITYYPSRAEEFYQKKAYV